MTEMLSEKDKVIHSLAHDLVLASEYIEDWGTYVDPYFKEKHDLKGDVKKFKDIALSALNSITDKGEKDAEIAIKNRIEAENRNKAFMADLADSEGSF